MGSSWSQDPDVAADSDSALDALLREAARVSEAPRARSLVTWPVGTKFAAGRLTVLRRIGAGGMGVVYEAHDAERRAQVALKTLVDLDPKGVYRLKSEFRALSHVRHPNLVQLHELFCDRGCWFFTMDVIEGQPFDRWVRPGQLDEGRLRGALSQLIAAIEAIHGGGKLHRDLKPSNVLVTREGRVVVLDFGMVVAPQGAAAAQTLAEEHGAGTPAYMAPEQAAGASASAASDVYALGVMLFEGLTGRRPFEGRAGEVLAAKQREDAPRVGSLVRDAPRDLAAWCDRMLARVAEQRPALESLRSGLGCAAEELGPGRAARPSSPPAAPAFFGRQAELAALRAALRASLDGRPGVLVVSGESGMGKSALVESFLHELREQGPAVVLAGRCNERENVPYKALDALVDELSRYLRRIPAEEAAALMPREAFALSRLFPVLERVPVIAEGPQRAVLNLHDLQARAFNAFSDLVARLRDRRPLVLFIDDLQWTDEDSVRFLRQLLLHPDPAPLLLVFAHRSEQAEQNPLLQAILAAASENRALSVGELRVGALDDAALAACVRAQLTSGAAAAQRVGHIARESGGSPFFAGELARAALYLEPDAPVPTLTDALAQHVERLPRAARRVLTVLALAGQPLLPALALDAAGLADGHELIDLLRSERLLRVSSAIGGNPQGAGRTVECYHDHIRELVAGAAEPTLTCELFAGLARALQGQASADPELLTRCLEGAGLAREAARHARQAAERAMQALAFERAARLYEKALALGDFSPEVARALQLARAEALARSGDGLSASEVYLAAREGAEPAQAAELSQQAGVLLLMLGRNVRGREVLAEGLRPLGIGIPKTALSAFVALSWARLRLWLRGLRLRRETTPDALTLARLSALRSAATSFGPSDTLRFALFNARWLLLGLRSGHAVDVARAIGGELVLASYLPSTRKRIPALIAMGQGLLARISDVDASFSLRWGQAWASLHDVPWCGEWEAGLAHTEACIELAREHPVSIGAYVEPWCQYMRGALLASLGRLHEVRGVVRTQFERELSNRNLTVLPPLSTLAALVLPALGQLEQAERIVRESRAVWRSDEVSVQDLNLLLAVSFLARYRGRAQEGWQEFRELWRRIDASLMPRVIMGPMMNGMGGTLAAAASREVGQASERESLRREAVRLLERATRFGSRAARASVRTQLACLAGDRAGAARGLRELLALPHLSPLVQQAAARQLGVALGGAEGSALVARADAWFHARDVQMPQALSALVVPGPELLSRAEPPAGGAA